MGRERGAFRVDALTSISGDGHILARIEWNSFLHSEAYDLFHSSFPHSFFFFFPFWGTSFQKGQRCLTVLQEGYARAVDLSVRGNCDFRDCVSGLQWLPTSRYFSSLP